jgi:uncharacterized protein (TIGR00645 family)
MPPSSSASIRPPAGALLSILAQVILASRFLLVVFFFGLLFGLALFALRFLGEVAALAAALGTKSDEDFLIALLHLVDATLVASLVVMVALASYDSLVARLHGEADEVEMRWVSRTDHSNLKIKVATAMVAISSIHLLQVFLKLESYSQEGIVWRVTIHMVFLLGAVLLGVLDRIGRHGGVEKNESV